VKCSGGVRAVMKDVLTWGVLAAPVVIGVAGWVPGGGTWWAVSAALVLVAAAVALRRRRPVASLLVTVTLGVMGPWCAVPMLVMSYLAGRQVSRSRLVLYGFAAAFTIASLLVTVDIEMWFIAIGTLTFAGVFPWLVGRYRRQHAELVAAGWERAQILEREQRGIAVQARLRERARIAQDMHDSLGHELSLIALRAAVLEMTAGLDDQAGAAVGELRASAAAATERLRDVIGVLREDSTPPPIEPAGETVAQLAERAEAAGMVVELQVEGEPVALLPMVDRAAYRVVQEALTNAAKHAPGACVTVRLAYLDEEMAVTVSNGSGDLPVAPVRGRRGLTGLQERVRLCGGTLRAGPVDAGWQVAARLPYAAKAMAPVEETAVESAMHLRRTRRGLIAAVAVPIVALLTITMGYYTYATYDAQLVPDDFQRLRVGQTRAELEKLIPGRQSPNRPERVPPAPEGAACEYYTSGNFPRGIASFRLCFSDGRLARKDDLRDPGADG
jgi:signal transduction histidine kinase